MKKNALRTVILCIAAAGIMLITGCPNAPADETYEIEGITLSQSTASMLVGDTLELTATVTPQESSDSSLSWDSTAQGIAAVDENGFVSALSSGTAVISVSSSDGTVSADCTVTVRDQFIVSFESDGGTAIDSVTVIEGNGITEPTAPEKTGYEFDGWYSDEALTDAWDFTADTVTANMTLYAKWRLPTFSVSFETNGGSAVADVSVTQGTPVAEPEDPERNGYSFAGWYSDSGLTTAFDFTQNITGNTTLYAGWDLVTYSIHYDLFNSTYSGNGLVTGGNFSSYTILSADIVLNDVDSDGVRFLGWFTDEAFTEEITVIASGSYGDMTIYAKWAAEQTITFEANGGSGSMDTQTVAEGIPEALSANAFEAPDGMGFAGWSEDSAASEADYIDEAEFTAGDEDVTLYAVWKSFFSYTTDGGNATITGFSEYYDSSSEITIPASIDGNPVTALDDWAFNNERQLTSVIISEGISVLNENAFDGCSGLESVSLPSTLVTIERNVFAGCSSLPSITIPAGVTSIGPYVFNDCTVLASITVEEANTAYCSIDGVLYNEDKTTLMKYPQTEGGAADIESTVTVIDAYAFADNPNLTSAVLPEGLTQIYSNAFDACSSLASVTFPSTLEQIGSTAFSQCSSLTALTFPSSLTDIRSNAFQYCRGITSITFVEGLENIWGQAFNNCDGLTSVSLPAGMEKIYGSAFYGCDNLQTVSIGEGLTAIYDDAFRSCQSLESVSLPASLSTLSNRAFLYTPSLTNITVAGGSSSFYSDNGVLFNLNQTSLLVFPAARDAESYSYPTGLTAINDYAFYSYQGNEVTVPEGVTTLGYGVFSSAEVASLILPTTITNIGAHLTSNSNALASVTINAVTPPALGVYRPFGASNSPDLAVYVPAESVSAYQNAEDWVALDVAQYVVSQ